MKPFARTMLALTMLIPMTVALDLAPVGGGPGGVGPVAQADAARRGGDDQGTTVWGRIKHYGNDYIIVDERRYRFAKNVVIDTYSLEQDRRGNVRLTLDAHRQVTHVFFYGIDMPDVVRRYKM